MYKCDDLTNSTYGSVEVFIHSIKWHSDNESLPDSIRMMVRYHGDMDNEIQRSEYGDDINAMLMEKYGELPYDAKWEIQSWGTR